MTGALQLRLRRVYEDPAPGDGTRVLVDRLWPRGVRKDAGRVDDWLRAVAPSDQLRRWYGHEPAKFEQFRHLYQEELEQPEAAAALARLRELVSSGPVTLVTATRDISHSQAAVLADVLRGQDDTS
ncbi:MAG: DUF488 family protein [Actinobacteria bacterium]|nr:DUF488 family protein [Actinomycetota bacterium]MBO0788615.1 DUF488 family protein [Actinomycetota bacterium]MBO0816227.1 DUF488 family protein [Actinomycetota bacterium]